MQIGDIEVNEQRNDNGVLVYTIYVDGTSFTFDKKGIKLFLNEFILGNTEITTNQGYLVKIRNDKMCSFHKWFKLYGKNVNWDDIEVHHRNGDITDNRGINLRMMTKKEHQGFHANRKEMNRRKAHISSAYKTYKEKFLMNDPDATPQKINYFWREFKEENGIGD